jgi:nitric oxide reductase activation protein
MGAAIRHAAHLLSHDADTMHRLLLVISDGFAFDGDGYELTYAESDTRRALDESLADGLGVVCVSVASTTEDAVLQRTWGNVGHASIKDVQELDLRVLPLIVNALRTSGAISKIREAV